jgi:hypothetical protein
MNTWAALNALAQLGLILSMLTGLWTIDRWRDARHQNDKASQKRLLLQLVLIAPIWAFCIFSVIYCHFQFGK